MSPATVVNTIDQIDLSLYILTKYEVNEYVLRWFPSNKTGDYSLEKYGSFCRGHNVVTKVISMRDVYGPQKQGKLFAISRMGKYTPLTLPTCGYFTSRPKFCGAHKCGCNRHERVCGWAISTTLFYWPQQETLVQWQLGRDKEETWESFENHSDVDAFHHNCAANEQSAILQMTSRIRTRQSLSATERKSNGIEW